MCIHGGKRVGGVRTNNYLAGKGITDSAVLACCHDRDRRTARGWSAVARLAPAAAHESARPGTRGRRLCASLELPRDGSLAPQRRDGPAARRDPRRAAARPERAPARRRLRARLWPARSRGARDEPRVSLHPEGVAPRILNFAEWRAHLLDRLGREAVASGDPALFALHEELAGYQCDEPGLVPDLSAGEIAVPLRLCSDDTDLAFISTATTFGRPSTSRSPSCRSRPSFQPTRSPRSSCAPSPSFPEGGLRPSRPFRRAASTGGRTARSAACCFFVRVRVCGP